MATIQDCREYTRSIDVAGTATLDPNDVVCIVCGAVLQGSDANVQRHLDWHRRQFPQNSIEALLGAI